MKLKKSSSIRDKKPLVVASPVVLAGLLIALCAVPKAFGDAAFAGHWEGAIALPSGPLEIDVDLFGESADALTGDISIPMQGVEDLALGDIQRDDETLSFRMPGVPGDPTFSGSLSADENTFSGSFSQSGALLEFSLQRAADAATVAAAALASLGEEVEKAIADFNVPGLALAVVQGDQVVFIDGFGKRDREKNLPMTPDSLFAIGSTTKAMTATVLAMQVEEGKLAWDEPLVRKLPEFRLQDPLLRARVTPRDLLSHRTGLPRHDMLWFNVTDVSREELIGRFEHLEMTADLRERFQYNNLMFMTAGFLSGRLDGLTWEQTVDRRLFEPLGMERSNFSVLDSQQDDDFALPYSENEQQELELIPFRRIEIAGPAGAVNSTVREMTRWLRFNLAGGEIDGKRLIGASTLEQLHLPQMALPASPIAVSGVSQSAYGMGWFVEVYRGHRRVQHGGGIDGFVTAIAFYPDDDLGLVSFSNVPSRLPGLINQVAANRILGIDGGDLLAEALTARQARFAAASEAEKNDDGRVLGTAPSHGARDYAGVYEHPGYGRLRIEGDSPSGLAFVFNGIKTPLEHWHYDVWNGVESDDPTFEDKKLSFYSDLEGQIHQVVIAMELTAAPIVFTKKPSEQLSSDGFLQKYVGTYRGSTGQTAEIVLAKGVLTLHLPGQPVYTLEPKVSGRFGIAGLQGFSVGFGEEEGKVLKIVFYQPNGTFESTRVED